MLSADYKFYEHIGTLFKNFYILHLFLLPRLCANSMLTVLGAHRTISCYLMAVQFLFPW